MKFHLFTSARGYLSSQPRLERPTAYTSHPVSCVPFLAVEDMSSYRPIPKETSGSATISTSSFAFWSESLLASFKTMDGDLLRIIVPVEYIVKNAYLIGLTVSS